MKYKKLWNSVCVVAHRVDAVIACRLPFGFEELKSF